MLADKSDILFWLFLSLKRRHGYTKSASVAVIKLSEKPGYAMPPARSLGDKAFLTTGSDLLPRPHARSDAYPALPRPHAGSDAYPTIISAEH